MDKSCDCFEISEPLARPDLGQILEAMQEQIAGLVRINEYFNTLIFQPSDFSDPPE